ncbi:uncharacterized protein EDB93DRAFT_1335158 [Suillus bovinus]|uniref:uncharacterized protein n=1 Tax=Suillus bovinus TaxID=48563 RepID=UPI001B86E429|nr:uncharacterized protein EDB93DRAFT_1335158 [Suillus bovinus]KAG2157775.1 hypothetical protein EDB93DRAFT_1335158 [Suillus bovinus]
MTCRTASGECDVKTDGDPNPHFKRPEIDQAIHIDQKKIVEDCMEEKGERKELPELRGRDRGRPPILKKKKSSYDLRDIFQTQEAASSASSESSPVTSNISSPVIPSPDMNKVISPAEIITAPVQQQQTTPPNRSQIRGLRYFRAIFVQHTAQSCERQRRKGPRETGENDPLVLTNFKLHLPVWTSTPLVYDRLDQPRRPYWDSPDIFHDIVRLRAESANVITKRLTFVEDQGIVREDVDTNPVVLMGYKSDVGINRQAFAVEVWRK